jgi:O-methyltransferase
MNRNNEIYARFKPYTMIPSGIYVANLELAEYFSRTKGAIVECGTWKGGMIAGMAELLGVGREYWLFDSFEGLPKAKPVDGEAALHWQADVTSPNYFNNCSASETEARAAMRLAGIHAPQIRRGWFAESLPGADFRNGISVLRLDADWYDSTMDVLTHLFDKVNTGGCLIVDDYYTWDGCARAVHDFLSRRERTERIGTHKGVCFIVKRP